MPRSSDETEGADTGRDEAEGDGSSTIGGNLVTLLGLLGGRGASLGFSYTVSASPSVVALVETEIASDELCTVMERRLSALLRLLLPLPLLPTPS